MQDKVKQLVLENDGLKRDWTAKETTLLSHTEKVRNEKTMLEK